MVLWPHWSVGNEWHQSGTMTKSFTNGYVMELLKLSIAERLHFYLTNEQTRILVSDDK